MTPQKILFIKTIKELIALYKECSPKVLEAESFLEIQGLFSFPYLYQKLSYGVCYYFQDSDDVEVRCLDSMLESELGFSCSRYHCICVDQLFGMTIGGRTDLGEFKHDIIFGAFQPRIALLENYLLKYS